MGESRIYFLNSVSAFNDDYVLLLKKRREVALPPL
jgi:hypothetical protein